MGLQGIEKSVAGGRYFVDGAEERRLIGLRRTGEA